MAEIINKVQREEGGKKSHFKYFTIGKDARDKKGNKLPYAVQLVAECVAFYRQRMKPIKTIWLAPSHWNAFDYWSRSHMTEKEADSKIELWTFDGVEINPMPAFHILKNKSGSEEMDWDFYIPEPVKPESIN